MQMSGTYMYPAKGPVPKAGDLSGTGGGGGGGNYQRLTCILRKALYSR